jgi:hypothetical protein
MARVISELFRMIQTSDQAFPRLIWIRSIRSGYAYRNKEIE